MTHLVRLDALRALAAFAVLVSHVGFWTGTTARDFSGGLVARGDAGVAVFFALSAFLLLSPWVDGRPPATRDYAVRRAARILPAYWVALAAVLLVGGLGVAEGGWRDALSHLFLMQAFTGADYQGFSQSWSLSTEATFYLLVPVIGLVLARASRPLAWIGGAAAVGLAVHATSHAMEPGTFSRALGLSALGHAAWFAAGAAVLVARRRVDRWPSVPTCLLAATLVFLVASSPVAGPRDLTSATVLEAVVKELLYAVLAGLLLLAAARPWPDGASEALTRWLGDISYGVFLWHLVVLQVLYSLTNLPLFSGQFWWVLAVVTSFTLVLATASATFIEKPVRRWARARTGRPVEPSPAP